MRFSARTPLLDLPFMPLMNAAFGLAIVSMLAAAFVKTGVMPLPAAPVSAIASMPAIASVPAIKNVPPSAPTTAPAQQTPLPANPDVLVRELGHAIALGKAKVKTPPPPPPAPVVVPYEQVISSWIGNFKIYPARARMHGMEGKGMLLIRIDRTGKVRRTTLEASTGHKTLDEAMLQTIKNANPLPPAPKDYKPGEKELQFKIPIIYSLQ